MLNPKKKNKETVENKSRIIKNVSGSVDSESTDELKIKNAVAFFESERRKHFEKVLEVQSKAEEARLRGQLPELRFDNKNYQIQIVVVSSRIKVQPILGFAFDVPFNFNEFDYAKVLQDGISEFYQSSKYRDVQQMIYNKLKMQGMKASEIYAQVEIRYSEMDSKEKRKLYDRLRKGFDRKTHKKADKNGKLSTSSELS